MKLTRRQFVSTSSMAAGVLCWSPAANAQLKSSTRSSAVIGQSEANAIGNAILERGGNAADAMVAAAFMAGVVALPSTGIGGYGGSCMVSTADGRVTAIDCNTVAPAALKEDQYFDKDQNAIRTEMHASGWTSVGVPGVLAGLQKLHDLHGTLPLAELMRPAIDVAKKGFPVSAAMSGRFRTLQKRFLADPGSAGLYLQSGQALPEGATYRNLDLAKMLERLAEDGRVDAFYKGKYAEQIAVQCQRGGGWLTADDMAAYNVRVVEPIKLEWKGYELFTVPPSSGGLTVLQTLGTLKALGWPDDIDAKQRDIALVEAIRIAWGDRLKYLGDPDQVDVPMARLLSTDLAASSAEQVKQALRTGKPLDIETDGRGAKGTIHLNAIDKAGMSVALTFTHGDGFGACVTVDGLGLTLGHGLSRFDPRPGHANSPGPSKRPLHNMCPTVVLRSRVPVMAIGATGGRRIPSAVTCVLASRIGKADDIQAAVKSPRVHSEGGLEVTVEAKHESLELIKGFGYKLTQGAVASLTAIERTVDSQVIVAT